MAIDPITGEEITEDAGTALAPQETAEVAPPKSSTEVAEGLREAGQTALTRDPSTYAGYEAPTENIKALEGTTPVEEYMTPETTVAGQLERLLEQDSPLKQQARRESREAASALGMMSSSAAVGDAYARQTKALVPVAAQDAETAAKFQLQKQATENKIREIQVEGEVSGALTVQKAEIAEQQTKINQNWDALMKSYEAEQQSALEAQRGEITAGIEEQKSQALMELEGLRGDISERIKTLEGDITRELQQQEIDAEVEQTIVNQANEAMNNYQITVQSLLANDSFLDNFAGDPTAMRSYFNELFVTVETSLEYSAKAAGVYWDEASGEGLKPYIEDLVAANAW